ncbi:hypothetical protein GCM10011512_21750 [Tersicoccus solisilvae]|uniref:Uncharacterized protein n=1 Tax=Tersicoccus solisilvae TaxID=1882339 RepID=A0ABQ1PCA1_9MICC|nr:hypothetical protein GCM10011512_21750 [Tersicoccus solisilvae]
MSRLASERLALMKEERIWESVMGCMVVVFRCDGDPPPTGACARDGAPAAGTSVGGEDGRVSVYRGRGDDARAVTHRAVRTRQRTATGWDCRDPGDLDAVGVDPVSGRG